MRIGHGYDVHPLVAGRDLILGGVRIPHGKGLLGHSDADVLIHAICDACLGAAGLGDIGRHFPDTDPQYKDIDSRKLLRKVKDALAERGWQVANIDCTLVIQAPRMPWSCWSPANPPFFTQMSEKLILPPLRWSRHRARPSSF